ncbi:Tet(A)/Tet(B)/Tet(C) family tetracycline efflux MFS transporter [Paraburkholderia hospita]|uniref:Tet(A)/Tet(B)/Tet(C) family tetracycline efflux MFS transporter n=1 Tax=Paraburkholderia hospita TaxID=169430 RepID=UPI0002719D43|nr:Tet(A)/Tet(B)/Tet(C) family tetracycline efflux MFS transporter [Paraburkholderia hospita]EUC18909.1 major facilitator superfamily MFS_1 [Burkholderia sp. BT03]SKC66418.1 MFS transporter, DHA1 family, tetracycline resistance protein [Paraburkholderia hospita]
MNKPRFIALTVVTLDAMGLGLVMPVLPTLLRGFVPGTQVAWHYGTFLALYALMQVFFAPLLGRLSDRRGRRPVLLLSLAGAAVDYAVMAMAPALWVLYIGRVISGVTGATGAVAASTIADTTQEDERARWFGYMGACYGAGMIAGPAIGGAFGGVSAHAPFMAAALLNGAGFLLACVFLKETQSVANAVPTPISVNPFDGFRLDSALRALMTLFGVFFILQFIGQIPASLWIIYGEDRFHWNTTAAGASLAAFGAVHALFQAFVTGPVSSRLGEKRALLLGMTADGTGFVLMAFATQGWMVFPILFLLAAGGVAMPALQAMLSKAAPDERQGALQGTLTSLTNLSAIIGPLGFTMLYTVTAKAWSGWIWIVGAALYVVCLPALRRSHESVSKGYV